MKPKLAELIVIPEDAVVDPGPGRVLVRVASSVEGKYGPLVLPATGDEKKFFGRIESLPTHYVDGLDEQNAWLEVGDLVFFGKYSGTMLQINRDSFIICKETDILARVRNKMDYVVVPGEFDE